MPLVSVVIPTFNSAAHVAATLDSVLNQTYGDLEVVVSDHASVDDTWEIVDDYRRRHGIRAERISSGGGAARNWNHVTSLARGEYLKLVCADDVLHPDCLERQAEVLTASRVDTAMVASSRDVVDAAGRPLLRAVGLGGLQGPVASSEAVRRLVRSGTNLLGEPACVLLRRRALEAAGGWDGRDGYVIDLRTYFRVLRVGGLYALPGSVAAFRVSHDQWSARLLSEQSDHMVRLLREVAGEKPGVARVDLAMGLMRARLRAVQRRAFYAVHRGRL